MDILNGRYWVFDDWIEGGSRGAVKDGFHELASCRDKNGSLSCLKSKAQAILLASPGVELFTGASLRKGQVNLTCYLLSFDSLCSSMQVVR